MGPKAKHTNQFMPGDKIECVDARLTKNLDQGRMYVVKSVGHKTYNTDFIWVHGLEGSFFHDRFKLVSS